jgi:MFS family permease
MASSLESSTSSAVTSSSRAGWVLPVHASAVVLIQSVQNAVFFILPLLAKKHFEAGDWATTVITSAPTVLFMTGIFWNDVFRKCRLGRYLWAFWLMSAAPMLLAPFIENFWHLLPLHLLVSVGIAGYHPAASELLKRLYPDSSRGRFFSVLSACNMLANAGLGFCIGWLLDRNPESFRWYMPVAACLQGAGLTIMYLLARRFGLTTDRVIEAWGRNPVRRVFEPVTHMMDVLREDRIFARYEAAFMTYGIGWMVCFALMPLYAVDRHNLEYDVFASATHVPYLVCLVAALVPCGLLMDRIGATRLSGLSFGLLALYPLGLMWARTPTELGIVSAIYGLAHSGTTLGWTLGPVSLAPTPAKVPQYVAIHSTLVGLRGAIFQGAGVLLYKVTGSFIWPLASASIAFAWGAWQMFALHRVMRAATPAVAAGDTSAVSDDRPAAPTSGTIDAGQAVDEESLIERG